MKDLPNKLEPVGDVHPTVLRHAPGVDAQIDKTTNTVLTGHHRLWALRQLGVEVVLIGNQFFSIAHWPVARALVAAVFVVALSTTSFAGPSKARCHHHAGYSHCH